MVNTVGWRKKISALLFPIHNKGDIDTGVLRRILKQANILPEEWNNA